MEGHICIQDISTENIIENHDVKNGMEIYVAMKLSSIGFTGCPMDIVRDYLETSFCAENICKYIEVKDSFFDIEDYKHIFKIRCICTNADKLSTTLSYYTEMLTSEFSIYNEADTFDFYEQLSTYERGLSNRLFTFPYLADNYWANYVNAGILELSINFSDNEAKFLSEIYSRHHDYKYGFWRGAKSHYMKDKIFFSTESWLVPPETQLSNVLNFYFSNVKFLEAEYIVYNNAYILVSDTCAVKFEKLEYFNNVLLKLINSLKNKLGQRSSSISLDLFGNEKTVKKRKMFCPEISNKNKYLVSEFGEIILITVDGYTSVFFDPTHLNFEELKELNAYLFPAYAKTQNLISRAIMVNCDWSKIDDDIFEQICYDIICLHPKFDSSTIRKMGKSKSRDGGRDITVKSKNLPGKDGELYVFQCKFYSNNTSLSASKLPNAGNTIMQYGAKGYGVFTTTVIDSTLFDMLDGFNQHQGIDVSICWSKYELERYINNNPILVNKYFNIDNATNSSKNS